MPLNGNDKKVHLVFEIVLFFLICSVGAETGFLGFAIMHACGCGIAIVVRIFQRYPRHTNINVLPSVLICLVQGRSLPYLIVLSMSPLGTFPTCRGGLTTSVHRGGPEVADHGRNDAIDPKQTP
jgi:hypothetical protein